MDKNIFCDNDCKFLHPAELEKKGGWARECLKFECRVTYSTYPRSIIRLEECKKTVHDVIDLAAEIAGSRKTPLMDVCFFYTSGYATVKLYLDGVRGMAPDYFANISLTGGEIMYEEHPGKIILRVREMIKNA